MGFECRIVWYRKWRFRVLAACESAYYEPPTPKSFFLPCYYAGAHTKTIVINCSEVDPFINTLILSEFLEGIHV